MWNRRLRQSKIYTSRYLNPRRSKSHTRSLHAGALRRCMAFHFATEISPDPSLPRPSESKSDRRLGSDLSCSMNACSSKNASSSRTRIVPRSAVASSSTTKLVSPNTMDGICSVGQISSASLAENSGRRGIFIRAHRTPRHRGNAEHPQNFCPVVRLVRSTIVFPHFGQTGVAAGDGAARTGATLATGRVVCVGGACTSRIIRNNSSPPINSIGLSCAKLAASRV